MVPKFAAGRATVKHDGASALIPLVFAGFAWQVALLAHWEGS